MFLDFEELDSSMSLDENRRPITLVNVTFCGRKLQRTARADNESRESG